MFKTTIALSLLALTAIAWQQQNPRFSRPLKEEKMILEHNVTLGEAVVRVEAESEEELDRVQILKPDGERLLVLEAPNGTVRGLSGFKLELQEASLATILATYTEGTYDIRARMAGGKVAQGRAVLSFDLPPAPRLVYPFEGALVPTSGLVVRWLADRSAAGYRIQLEQGETDGLAIQLPPGRNSLVIPDGFLASGVETQLEIAALGANGNRTVAEVHFTTR
jgi:hypothetical protein